MGYGRADAQVHGEVAGGGTAASRRVMASMHGCESNRENGDTQR